MNRNILINYILAFVGVVITLYVGDIFAQDEPPNTPPAPPKFSDQICKIRQLFCGSSGLVLVGTAVFMVGLLMFAGKITWQTALVMSTGAVIFANVEFITLYLAPSQIIVGSINDAFQGEMPFNVKCICIPILSDFLELFDAIKGDL